MEERRGIKIQMKKEMEKGGKKAQSNIIVTVLLVLIGLVAVSLLSVWIINFVRENTAFDNASLELFIEPSGTYTTADYLYNGISAGESMVFVKVRRGAGNVELSGIKFIFYKPNGRIDSYTSQTIIGELESRTYYLSNNYKNYVKVEIAPIVKVNGKEKTLAVTSSIDLNPSAVTPDVTNPAFISINSM